MLTGQDDLKVVRTVVFIVARRVLGLIWLGSSPNAKDAEIAVLRHQLMVLHLQITQPRYAPPDGSNPRRRGDG
jgi:putative transposase